MTSPTVMYRHVRTQKRHTLKRYNPTKFKMKACPVALTATIFILALLPYSSTLSLPSGDPAPGRSPGPPEVTNTTDISKDYEDSTINEVEVTTFSEVTSEAPVDACAFARYSSDSDSVVTVSVHDSDVNLTVSHPDFDSEVLVKGVSYDVHLQFDDENLRDFAIYSIVGDFIRGNFTPTTILEKPCWDDQSVPHFIPKHDRSKRYRKHRYQSERTLDYRTDSVYFRPRHSFREERSADSEESVKDSEESVKDSRVVNRDSLVNRGVARDEEFESSEELGNSKRAVVNSAEKSAIKEETTSVNRANSNEELRSLIIKEKWRGGELEWINRGSDSKQRRRRSLNGYRQKRRGDSLRMRRRFFPARILSGPLIGRSRVLLQWSMTDAMHLDGDETNVVFRLRYRKTTSATIYQVFFTKLLRLECAVKLRGSSAGRVHSGRLPRAHSCRLLIPPPAKQHALLLELYKFNVPCATGFIRFAPNTPLLCGKLEQVPVPNRRFIYHATNDTEATGKVAALELHGRPAFAATYRQVDYCHEVLLTARNGSFDVEPTNKLQCSYHIHLPYGNKVALRLQMGTGTMTEKQNDFSTIIHEDFQALCKGMELLLEDGELRWKHCSQPGDPLRSVQIISQGNSVRLNISVVAKKNSSAMWLKVWWMDKPIEETVGNCEYGWVLSEDFCLSAFRESKKAWRQAEAECVRLGGHLASILNERQQKVVDQLLLNAPGAGVDDVYWIGATDAVHEGEFRWSDGLPFSFAHWFPGWRKHSSQPNDDGTSGQDCVEARREFPPRPPPAAPTYMWNDRGCREHNYFVCEKPSVDDPYTASHIQCNETIILSHSHPQATVWSPGYPRSYPDDVHCVSEVRAPHAHTLRLHFEELNTEHEPHCIYDFLEITELGLDNVTDLPLEDWLIMDHHDLYSSENEVWEETESPLPESDSTSAGWSRDSHASHTRRLCGDWGGKLKLLRYQSRGNWLRLRFRSDHSRHYAGYRAKITVADSQSCMDVKQVLYNGHCYLFSGYPRASWDTAKQVCEGLNMHLSSVHSGDEERFIVSGIKQSSDYSAGTVYWLGARLTSSGGDFSWVDGSAVAYQGWPPYNNTEEMDEACLGVQWKSSPVPSQPSGLYWTLHKCVMTGGYVCKRRLNPEHVVKNRTVEGTAGELTSPNYPGMYDNDLDYWVHVDGPDDTRLVFVFRTIDLEYQKDCLYDFVEVRDPLTLKSSRYCGSVGETRWVASNNKAILHFHSDYTTQGSGFSLSWSAVELVGCPSQTFTSKEGVIKSPNYPQFLLPNLDCTIDILAPAGRRVFLNISIFDFGYGLFENGVPLNVTDSTLEDTFLEVQVDLQTTPIRPFLTARLLTNSLFVSQAEILRLRLRTGENVTGKGFLSHFKTVSFLNATHVLNLQHVRSGQLSSPNWPAPPPARSQLRMRLFAPHTHTLTAAFAQTRLVTSGDELAPCGEGNGWIEVKDSYTDFNGSQWTLCEVEGKRIELSTPLVINSYLHALTVTQHAGERGVRLHVALQVNEDPDYHSKLLVLPDDTNLESCFPNPCHHGGRCASDDSKNFCQCAGYYTGIFCLLTACERSPCVFGNCSLTLPEEGGDAYICACARGWRGKRCAERVRPCASKPCNNRGACIEKDGGFLCQCNPSWKGKRCEMPNPTPKITSLGQRMMQEPFWLGLFAVFLVMGIIALVWCAKRHFPEKIEKLLAEEADRCARPAVTREPAPGPHRTLLTRLGIRKPSVTGLAQHPRAARTFSLDDLLKPPPGRKEWSEVTAEETAHSATDHHSPRHIDRTPSPRKKRNNSTPTKKNAAEKKQILQQLISPATGNDHSKKITMGDLIQMSEKRTLSTVESAPAFVDYGTENKETSFASEASTPSTSPSMRHISDPKLEKKVTFARLLNRVSAEMSSSSDMDMVNTIAIPMAVIADRSVRARASSTPPSPGVEVRSPHSTSSNQGSDSMSSLDLTLAHAALRKYSRTPKISSADSILAMFRNFSSSSAAMVSRASSGGISASSTPSASSPQDDTVDGDDISLASSHIPSLAPDSPVSRPHNTIEIQVLDPLSAHKSHPSGSNLLHPPSILLEVPSGINKCLSPIRELPTPLPTPIPTPLPTPLPSPRMPRARMESDIKSDSTTTCVSPSEDELDEIRSESKPERPTSGLRLKLQHRQTTTSTDTPTPSTHVTDSPSPSCTHSQDSEREESSPSPNPPALCVPVLTIERPSPGSPPPRRTPPHLEFQPPPLITVTYNASEESDEPLSPRPPPPSGNMCYLSPFSMSARGERAPSESNLSSSGYSSMASPGPSRCGSSNPLCPSEMEDPGSGGGPSCFQRRRPLMKTNSSPATSNDDSNERRRGRSDSETLSDDPLLESNDEGIGTDERVDDVPSSAKEMENLVVLKELDVPQTLCSPSGVTKCSIVKCISVERELDEKICLRPPTLLSDCSRPLSPVSSRSESPISDKTGFGRFSPQFYGRQLPFTDSDGLYEFPSSDCVKGSSVKLGSGSQRKAGRRRDRRTTRTASHEAAGSAKSTLPHMPHSMHNLLEVPGCRDAATRGRSKSGRRRSRSQAPAPPSSSSSEDSVSNASVASVASARELRLPPDIEMQDTSSKISSSLDLTEDSRKPPKVNKLKTISNQIRFLRRLERSLKMKEKETYPVLSDDEGDESSSVTSPLLQARKDLIRVPGHAVSAPLLGPRPKITRQRRYDRSLLSEDTRTLNVGAGNDNSD